MATFTSRNGVASDLIQELNPSYRWQSNGGWLAVRRFRGRQDKVRAKADELVLAGGALREIDLAPEREPWWILSATYGDDVGIGGTGSVATAVTTLWSVEGIELQQDLWELPAIKAQLALAEAFVESKIPVRPTYVMRLLIDALLAGRPQVPIPDNPNQSYDVSIGYILSRANAWSMDPIIWEQFIRNLFAGVTAFNQSSVALRKTRIIPPAATDTSSMAGVGSLFTTATLTSVEAVPATIKFTLPSTGAWLKKAPRIQQLSTGNWQVYQEWWWAANFSPFLYGTPT